MAVKRNTTCVKIETLLALYPKPIKRYFTENVPLTVFLCASMKVKPFFFFFKPVASLNRGKKTTKNLVFRVCPLSNTWREAREGKEKRS